MSEDSPDEQPKLLLSRVGYYIKIPKTIARALDWVPMIDIEYIVDGERLTIRRREHGPSGSAPPQGQSVTAMTGSPSTPPVQADPLPIPKKLRTDEDDILDAL